MGVLVGWGDGGGGCKCERGGLEEWGGGGHCGRVGLDRARVRNVLIGIYMPDAHSASIFLVLHALLFGQSAGLPYSDLTTSLQNVETIHKSVCESLGSSRP